MEYVQVSFEPGTQVVMPPHECYRATGLAMPLHLYERIYIALTEQAAPLHVCRYNIKDGLQ